MSATPQRGPAGALWMKIIAFCRHFRHSTLPSTGVEDGRSVADSGNAARE
jgi:hypothetical protein